MAPRTRGPGTRLLFTAAMLSFIAAALHLAIIVGGGDWYRFFGAGEQMALLAESGSAYPARVTLAIAFVLGLWGCYGLSGAGVIIRLPLLRVALLLITSVYLLRGVGGLFLPWLVEHPALAQNSLAFWVVSSTVCMVFGIFHLLGVMAGWRRLQPSPRGARGS